MPKPKRIKKYIYKFLPMLGWLYSFDSFQSPSAVVAADGSLVACLPFAADCWWSSQNSAAADSFAFAADFASHFGVLGNFVAATCSPVAAAGTYCSSDSLAGSLLNNHLG